MGKHIDILKQLLEYWWNKHHKTQWDDIQTPNNQVYIDILIYDYLKYD